MATATEVTHKLCCPACGWGSIRTSLLGEILYRTAVDPMTGEVQRGGQIMATPYDNGPVPLYVCGQCSYSNVVPSMFVVEA